jgi:TonB family protein
MIKSLVGTCEKTLKESRTAMRGACSLHRSRHLVKLRPIATFALILSALGTAPFHADSVAQQNRQTQVTRKVLKKVEPAYPEIARHAGLKGNVRLQVKVAPDGSTASVQALGGSPVFVKAAVEATKKWQWQRDSGFTEEVIEFTFGN